MIKSFYAMNFDYEMKVANQVAAYAPARKKAAVVAQKTASSAKSALSNVATTNRTRRLRDKAAGMIMVKDAGRTFARKKVTPIGSKIPVYLVVSNHWSSRRFEYGYGNKSSFPASHFLAVSARASRKNGVLYYSRDWGK